MPYAAPRRCTTPRCNETVVSHGKCDKHRPVNWHTKRPSVLGNPYGKGWGTQRKAALRKSNYLCAPCLALGRYAPAVAVDHVVPVAEGGTNDPNNLQGICSACHKTKTTEEQQRGRERRKV